MPANSYFTSSYPFLVSVREYNESYRELRRRTGLGFCSHCKHLVCVMLCERTYMHQDGRTSTASGLMSECCGCNVFQQRECVDLVLGIEDLWPI